MADPKSVVREPPVAVGQILAGKYRIDRVLGIGGMGVVVAATHMQLGQKVAIKLMLPEMLSRPVLAERFAREARAAASLKSAHVAHVFDVGRLDTGEPYMVMEYLDGNDLASIVQKRGALPVQFAVDCVLQACDAVAEAHSLGIVHRDLKPANLFLTTRNDGGPLVKVLDFGISKQKTAPDAVALTASTDIIGSPNYMSPEQFRSAMLTDARSDVWSLGVILQELLSGRLPFLAHSMEELASKVLIGDALPLTTLRPDATPELARIVTRCLEKDPSRRYPDIAYLAAELAPFAPPESRDLAQRISRITHPTGRADMNLSGQAVAVGTAVTVGDTGTPPRRSRWAFASAAILVSVLAVAGVVARSSLVRRHDTMADAATSALAAIAGNAPSAAAAASALAAPSTIAATNTTAAANSVATSTPPPGMAAGATGTPATHAQEALAPLAPSTPTQVPAAPAPSAVPASATTGPRPHVHAGAAPHTGAAPNAAPAAASPPTPTSAGAEPPSHRTSW